MHNIGLGECGDENIEDHLIHLTPHKVFRVDNSGRSSSNSRCIGNCLRRRLRRAIEEFIGILSFDVSEDLSFPSHEVAFGYFNMEVLVHVGDSENNWLRLWVWWVRLSGNGSHRPNRGTRFKSNSAID
jgi:hypothetical protein